MVERKMCVYYPFVLQRVYYFEMRLRWLNEKCVFIIPSYSNVFVISDTQCSNILITSHEGKIVQRHSDVILFYILFTAIEISKRQISLNF